MGAGMARSMRRDGLDVIAWNALAPKPSGEPDGSLKQEFDGQSDHEREIAERPA